METSLKKKGGALLTPSTVRARLQLLSNASRRLLSHRLNLFCLTIIDLTFNYLSTPCVVCTWCALPSSQPILSHSLSIVCGRLQLL